MEQIKGERGKCRQRSCNCLSWRASRYRCGVRLSLLLVVGTALVCGALLLLHGGTLDGAIASLVNQSNVCGTRQLSDQEAYDIYRRKHADLKIKVLSERDGAPFLQSRQPPRNREITIVTQTSMDRWEHLEKLAESWGGALCVVVYLKTRAEIVRARKRMMWFHDKIEAQGHCRLHLQMVIEEGFKSETEALTASYPVNALRNVALSMATTDLVFLLDVDFLPSPRLHEKLTANENVYADLINRTRNEGQLLVVAVFEAHEIPWSVRQCRTQSIDEPVPQSMQELRERWQYGYVTAFHPCHAMAQDATSYSHFLHPLTTEPYHVHYREFYEPYFIASPALIPKFDERFRGYGKNKAAHAFNCAVQGLSFVVLPEVYMWEIPHPRSEFADQFAKERHDPCRKAIMDVVYEVFKDELLTNIRQSV
ncbi:unnamed protein product [Calypogeia fissa]